MGKKKHRRDPKSWKIKRNRNGREHIDNCSTGYHKVSNIFCQIHHIVPVSSVSNGEISDQLEDDDNYKFIRKCLAVTEWNINDGHNCIGLPLKRAFVDKRASTQGLDKLPSHLVDHNPHYTDKVSSDLNLRVWQPNIRKAEECEFDPINLKKALEKRSDHWRKFLKDRGKKEKGTIYCWKNRHKIPDKWYIPFSMHPGTPIKRSPPPDWEDFSKSMKAYLKQMFKAIK